MRMKPLSDADFVREKKNDETVPDLWGKQLRWKNGQV